MLNKKYSSEVVVLFGDVNGPSATTKLTVMLNKKYSSEVVVLFGDSFIMCLDPILLCS